MPATSDTLASSSGELQASQVNGARLVLQISLANLYNKLDLVLTLVPCLGSCSSQSSMSTGSHVRLIH